MSQRVKDEVGNVYDKLTVLCRAGSIGTKAAWRCKCACGKELVATGDSLRAGGRRSCGCNRGEYTKARFTVHRESNSGGLKPCSPTYKSWAEMWARCSNSNHISYHNYGGRGISVCERWESYRNFLEDMGPRPEGSSLDRLDGSLGYCPENCRWSSRLTQNRNRRANIMLSLDGHTRCLAEWAEISGLKYMTLYNRVVVRGLPLAEALTMPVRHSKLTQGA